MKMLPLSQNFAAVFLILYCGFCYGFVLISSASAGAGGFSDKQFFEAGKAWTYKYSARVSLNEKDASEKEVGFSIDSDLVVESVWGSGHHRLLKFRLNQPKLSIKTTKSHDNNGFAYHSSELDKYKEEPFYALWNTGKIEKFDLPPEENSSLSNLKRGIISLFQFQLLDEEVEETDVSGRCTVSYSSTGPNKFLKTKKSCHNADLPYIANPNILLSTTVISEREASYELNSEIQYLNSVTSKEVHQVYVTANENIGNKIEAYQSLKLKKLGESPTVEAEDFNEAFRKITNGQTLMTLQSLASTREAVKSDETKTFSNIINDYRDSLKMKSLGSLASAKTIIPLIRAAHISSQNDLAKALNSKKNQKILHQLVDILGYTQTIPSHKAVMKKIHLDEKKHQEISERYLWACSLSSQPEADIINDLLKKYLRLNGIPEQVKHTLLLSIASMAHRLSMLPNKPGNAKIIKSVKEAIANGLDSAKDEERFVFLMALRNLKIPAILPILIEVIQKGSNKEGTLAWKAIRAMDPADWNEKILNLAKKTLYQLDKEHDSSSRTLAIDIILAKDPDEDTLRALIYLLTSKDKAFEVKQYLLQQIIMISEDNPGFKNTVLKIIRNDPVLNNYHILGQKGLSLALKRKFLDNGFSNGTLLTVQEMFGGIVKRGIVNVMMDKNGVSQEIFSLGVFSAGLGSFLSSDSDAGTDDVATAGMELAVLGTQIRPFTFFEGQGELMGHVWSGTASDRTTAYQALGLLQDHVEYIRLGVGFIAEVDVKGASSFDLSGKIEFSLWNRNAQSLVEKSGGFVFIGLVKVENSFVSSQVEFMTSIEPKLSLQTDIDFSSNVNLCMRLTQPDSLFRHNVYKSERVPGTKHRLRKVIYRKHTIPGKTYALNKKNSDMCGQIFK